MKDWTQKDGYDTKTIATETELNSVGSEIQLVRFHCGKSTHHHRKKTEFFFIYKGSGKLITEGKEIALYPGVSIVVQPFQQHTFINESEEPMEALELKTNNDPQDTYEQPFNPSRS